MLLFLILWCVKVFGMPHIRQCKVTQLTEHVRAKTSHIHRPPRQSGCDIGYGDSANTFKVFNNFLKCEGSNTFKSCLSGQTLSPGNKDLDKQGDQELRASEFLQTWENLPQRQASLQQSINLAFIVLWHKQLKKRRKKKHACDILSGAKWQKKVLWSEEKGTEFCGLNASAMFGKHAGGSMMSWSFLCYSVACTGKLRGNNEQSRIQSSKWTFSKAHATSDSTVT